MNNPRFVTLLGETTITGNTAVEGDAVADLQQFTRATVLLTVSAKTFDASTTLDIWLQYSPDEGTTWDDLVAFTQVTDAAVADGTYVVYLASDPTTGVADRATTDASLAANSVRDIAWGDRIRVKYDGANLAGTDTLTVKVEGWFYP